MMINIEVPIEKMTKNRCHLRKTGGAEEII